MRLAAGKQAQVLNSIVLPALSRATADATSAGNGCDEAAAGTIPERNGGAREGPSPSLMGQGGERGSGEEQCASDGAWAGQENVSVSVAVREPGTHSATQQQPMSSGETSALLQRVGERPITDAGERGSAVSGAWSHVPLKERIGHTKAEVAAGAVSGLATSLLVHLALLSQ